MAEKPSVARAIIRAFSINKKLKFERRTGSSRYNSIYEAQLTDALEITIEKTITLEKDDILLVSSVTGHVMTYEYEPPYDKDSDWHLTDPIELVKQQPSLIPTNPYLTDQLEALGKEADILSIATDWDSHGESIGGEIVRLCSFENKTVGRMQFVSTAPYAIMNAFQDQKLLDSKLVASVDSLRRQDLRMGASVTRYLTVGVQKQDESLRNLISYGPCQSSVLWIVATRYQERQQFVPEPYNEIRVNYQFAEDQAPFSFEHEAGQIFNADEAKKIFNSIKRSKKGTITQIEQKIETISRPLPLNTDMLESEGARYLQVSPKRVADVAERLYNHGFITYPRTESSYYLQKDLTPLVEKFTGSEEYGTIAKQIISAETAKNPSQGKFSKDHEPIRPVKAVNQEQIKKKIKGYNSTLACKVYNFIVRRFFATVGEEAKLQKQIISLKVKDEVFEGISQVISVEGYLAFYPYRKIEEKLIPELQQGENIPITPKKLEKETIPPPFWSESALIQEMARLGIGTDATRSSHIATVKYRRYVRKISKWGALRPTKIGTTLFNILDESAPELIHPKIRETVETWTQMVEKGEMEPQEVDEKVIDLTVTSLQNLKKNQNQAFSKLVDSIKEATGAGKIMGTCPKCSSSLILRSSAKNKRYLECTNKECDTVFPMPRRRELTVMDGKCQICKVMQAVKVGSGDRSWFLCPKCWTELATDDEPYFCSACNEDCTYSDSTIMKRMKELLPDDPDIFPVGKGIEVLCGKTLMYNGRWRKAVLLIQVGNKKQVRLYGWQKNKEGEWKLRQKFNTSKAHTKLLSEAILAFADQED